MKSFSLHLHKKVYNKDIERENKMKNILVLDTEATLGLRNPLIYDFGYKIVDREGTEIKRVSVLISEVFDTPEFMNSAYYKEKVPMYLEMYEKGEIGKTTFRKAFKEFVKDIKHYKADVIGAYNVAYDMRALNTTIRILDSESWDKQTFQKLVNQKNKSILCIWNLACETILDTDAYREYADKHNFKSEKGNYKTSAEVAFSYIKQMPDFVEKHTALADVEIEIEILLHILNHYKGNITYGIHFGSWKKVQV